MLSDLASVAFFPRITSITFEAEYLLSMDQIRRIVEKRLDILKIEYRGSMYDIGERLEIRQENELKRPWVQFLFT